VDCVVRGQKCLQNRTSGFEIGFEGGVGVDRSKMRREGVPNRGNPSKPVSGIPVLQSINIIFYINYQSIPGIERCNKCDQ